MFLVVAKTSDITITAVNITVASGTSAEVWTKKDSYVGFEKSPNSWKLVGGEMCKGHTLDLSLKLDCSDLIVL